MPIEHNSILNAQCHEPKHISDATTGDAGKVITPDAITGGTSELRQLTHFEIDKSADPHINAYISNNVTTTSITIAADLTLHTSSDYTAITLWNEETAYPSVGIVLNPSLGQFTVPSTGIYKLEYWLSVSSDTVNTLVGLRTGIDGNYFTFANAPVARQLKKVAGEEQFLSYANEYSLSTNAILTIGIAADKNCVLNIHEAGLILRRIA